ncbi:ATP-binding protein [Desulfuromonas sp. AOP6]|uniref:sensor histidine kinase n=1 Tax=Desulfuromonas sp. AOP6 TaxID=1566351 RepID=UPI00126B05D0|nr:ATP-binding protein [Desulfuromonas sp. AOP6]BCA80832.1 hypothetical protein AOP6_2619 [Desulfuromonas sp. AOP6]
MTLRNKMLATFIPIILAAIFITASTSIILFYDYQHKSLEGNLGDALHHFELEVAELSRAVQHLTQAVLEQEETVRALLENDHQTILRLSLYLEHLLKADSVRVLDREDEVQAQSHPLTSSGQSEANRNGFETGLSGTSMKSLVSSEHGLGVSVCFSVLQKDDVVGVIEIIYLLDEKFLGQIQRRYGVDVSVYDGDRLQATTFNNSSVLDTQTLKAFREGALRERKTVYDELFLDDVPYVVACKPLIVDTHEVVGAIVLSRSHEDVHRAVRLMVLALIGFAIAVGAFATVICLRFASELVGPLNSLVKVTEEIANGDLTQEAKVRGVLEVERLGTAFSAMTNKLSRSTTSIDNLNREVVERKSAEENLQKSNQELEEFTYILAHDLRNPITVSVSYADLIKENYRARLDEDAMEYLDEIIAAGENMAKLMDDLLALAKVGKVPKEEEPYDSKEIVDEVIHGRAFCLASSGAVMELGSLPTVRLPRSLLFQIFDNLIGNAVRYAAASGGVIQLTGERENEKVKFSVRDQGPGIPPEERERIFEVFFRGESGKKQAGTGIGLATVRKIARLYGGNAWVEETPGGGSTFRVEMVDDLATPFSTDEEQ